MSQNKKNVAEHRRKKRLAGLVPVEVWIYPHLKETLKQFIKTITEIKK
jgi:hypothetical protein